MAAPIPTVPRILPAAATPFLWSVMIPCYNAPPDYLAATLRSVLQQDPGRELMQIEVIDDASPNGAPVELVKKIAGDRVTVQREEKNRGLAGIWNRCIERAQGRWVHILHQDDLVRPGFYEKFKVGAESPAAPGLMYCRHAFIDGQGKLGWLSDLEAEQPGCLPDALPRQVRKQLIQTPSVVVRRAAYEAVGGFRSDLCFTLDWEMWCRLAQKFPVWFAGALPAPCRRGDVAPAAGGAGHRGCLQMHRNHQRLYCRSRHGGGRAARGAAAVCAARPGQCREPDFEKRIPGGRPAGARRAQMRGLAASGQADFAAGVAGGQISSEEKQTHELPPRRSLTRGHD